MKFPGLDPFIESSGLWEDFHSHLIEAIADDLSRQVPDRYVVRTGERAYVVVAESEGKIEHQFKPDVGITSSKDTGRPGGVAIAELATSSDSIAMRAFVSSEFRETFIEIHAIQPTRQLVTCLEVLSPSNKRPGTAGWELYARKRQGLLLGEANLVELDLLRGGTKPAMLDPWPACPYTILVARRSQSPVCRVWRVFFHRPLPRFPVPLADSDPDVMVDLSPMVEAIYRRYRYERDIDYARPLSPAATLDESAWLAEVLAPAGQTAGPK